MLHPGSSIEMVHSTHKSIFLLLYKTLVYPNPKLLEIWRESVLVATWEVAFLMIMYAETVLLELFR